VGEKAGTMWAEAGGVPWRQKPLVAKVKLKVIGRVGDE